jgi:hypothetical protein
VAPSPFPLWPNQEQKAPEEGDTNNNPAAILRKVQVGRTLRLCLPTSSRDIATAVALALMRIIIT